MEENIKRNVMASLIAMISGILGAAITIGAFLFVFNTGISPFEEENSLSNVSSLASSSSSNLTSSSVLSTNTSSKSTLVTSASIPENPSAVLDGYQKIIKSIAQKVRPSIVGIRTSNTSDQEIDFNNVSEASGVIISDNGYIVTNQHVIADLVDEKGKIANSSTIEVFVEGNKDAFKAQLIGFDHVTDLALLKIKATKLIPAKFGDSNSLVVGDMSIAIGSPGGIKYMGSVSLGIISGLNREVEFDDGTVMQLLQTDAAVNPGNSGGALVNSKGEVIGINNAGLEKTTFEGINFAIPSNLVVKITDEIKNQGYISGRPWLGIQAMGQDEFVGLQQLYGFPNGALVQEVDPSGPAAASDIQKSDIIIFIDGNVIYSTSDLRRILNAKSPEDRIRITIYRPITSEKIDKSVILKEKNR